MSLFDGMACGMLAFMSSGINVAKYSAYEIDKYAIAVTQHNFPEIEQNGDVFDADFTQYEGVDYLIGGSPCFTQGHLVLTKDGYKDISEIQIGDYVLTHTGKYQRVIRTNKREADVINVNIMGFPKFTTTANHPFYCIERSKSSHKEYKITHSWRKFSDNPFWKNAGLLTTSDFCGQHIYKSKDINEYNLDAETLYILGRYVADGHCRKNKRKDRKNSYQYQVVLSIGENKIDKFKLEVTQHKFSCYPHSDSVYRCVFSSQKLVEFIEEHGFGKGAENKNIPQFIFDLPNNLRKAFINGYIDGDGCFSVNSDMYYLSTVSKKLAFSLQRLIVSIYKTNVGVCISDNDRPHLIKGREINNNYPLYTICFKKELRKQSVAHIQNDIVWNQVKRVDSINTKDTVYNIEVENDNSYTVNNCIVHNCTYWSIAQKNDRRETEASGLGWELFSQYVRALKEAKPKYFIYENNKSMAKAIYESISNTFGFEPILINSALVSAQNRNRYYWCGIRNDDGTYRKADIPQPDDRGILLKDVLDGVVDREKSRAIISSVGRTTTREYFKTHQCQMAFEPVGTTKNGKSYCLTSGYAHGSSENIGNYVAHTLSKGCKSMVAEPVNTTKDGKSQTIKAQYQQTSIANICKYTSTYGATGVAEPVNDTADNKSRTLKAQYYKNGMANFVTNGGFGASGVAEPVETSPVRVGAMPRPNGELSTSQAFRVYSTEGKSVNLTAGGGGAGGKTGLYAIPVKYENGNPVKAISAADGKTYIVHTVKDGMIEIKGKNYPIKLADGFYIIRKLTVSECKRLQTVPEWYDFSVISDSQAYKCLGNGWTVEVIAHLMKNMFH